MVVYLSDGERGGERHFVGKAEAETGEGDAPFPRLGVATVHLVVASHASPAAWQLAAAEEEGWIMTLQTALALAQGLRDERRGDKYLFYFLTIYELGFGTLIQDGRNAALDYVKENQDAIYKLDGKEEKTPSLDKMKIVYSAYLKSNQKKNSDRFVYIVQMTYDSEVLYYMVCIPNINDSNEIDTHNIYGEKAYLTQEELDGKDFNGYVDRVYSSKYQIEQKK